MIRFTDTPLYTGKIIRIKKGHRLSLQYHKKKSESILVLSGKLQLQIGEPPAMAVLVPGQSIDIPAKTVHRFEAPFGDVDLCEVSVGMDEDIVRLHDDYGRV